MDAVVLAPTGTGKTLAYVLPAACRALPSGDEGGGEGGPTSALVLLPARELAQQVKNIYGSPPPTSWPACVGIPEVIPGCLFVSIFTPLSEQVHAVAAAVCAALGLRAARCAFCGGGSRSQQRQAIGQLDLALCVGTPGRVQDLLTAHGDVAATWAGRCGVLVMDEADKLLTGGDGEGGMAGQVDGIIALLSGARAAQKEAAGGVGAGLSQWFVSGYVLPCSLCNGYVRLIDMFH